MTPLPGVPTDGVTPWNPWKTLPHLSHVYVDFYATTPEGVHGLSCQASNGNIAIALDANLGQPERCWTLAHELVHIERGGGCQARPGNPIWGIQITKEEAAVNAIACDRLIPPRLIAADVRQALTLDKDPPIEDLADRYWVPPTVIQLALHRLKNNYSHLLTSPR